jgi:hypothetical protein
MGGSNGGYTLAIGMTVGRRSEAAEATGYTATAIRSLRTAGFTQPLHVFCEPGAVPQLPPADQCNLVVHANAVQQGCFRNFRQGSSYLLSHTDADWIMMLQDDGIWRTDGWTHMQAALAAPPHQAVGYLSPYTSPAMVVRQPPVRRPKPKAGKAAKVAPVMSWRSCHFHNKSFWGAVAMCFPRQSLIQLHAAPRFANHTHTRKLDVVVGNAIRRDLGLEILVAVPSLVDHIGKWSTLGRHKLRGIQWGRHGYAFKNA